MQLIPEQRLDRDARLVTRHVKRVCLPASHFMTAPTRTYRVSTVPMVTRHEARRIIRLLEKKLDSTGISRLEENLLGLHRQNPAYFLELTEHIAAASPGEQVLWSYTLTGMSLKREETDPEPDYETYYRRMCALWTFTARMMSGAGEDIGREVARLGPKAQNVSRRAMSRIGGMVAPDDYRSMQAAHLIAYVEHSSPEDGREEDYSTEQITYVAENLDEIELMTAELVKRGSASVSVISGLLDAPVSSLRAGIL